MYPFYENIMVAAINVIRNLFKEIGWKIDVTEYDAGNFSNGLEFTLINLKKPSYKVSACYSLGSIIYDQTDDKDIMQIQKQIKNYLIKNNNSLKILFSKPVFYTFIQFIMPVIFTDYVNVGFAPYEDKTGINKELGIEDETEYLLEFAESIELLSKISAETGSNCYFEQYEDWLLCIDPSAFDNSNVKIDEAVSQTFKDYYDNKKVYPDPPIGISVYESYGEFLKEMKQNAVNTKRSA